MLQVASTVDLKTTLRHRRVAPIPRTTGLRRSTYALAFLSSTHAFEIASHSCPRGWSWNRWGPYALPYRSLPMPGKGNCSVLRVKILGFLPPSGQSAPFPR